MSRLALGKLRLRRKMGLGANNLSGGGGVLKVLRAVPDNSNRFYLVTRGSDGATRSIRFQRNTGAAADGANLGVKWPEWRVTGIYGLSSFDGDPTSPAFTYSSDAGAYDFVGNTSSTTSGPFYSSYHGLGAGGALNSETILIDGVAWNPDGGSPVSGDSFNLTNDTTATNGTAILTRSLTTTINAAGGVHYKLNSISATGIGMVFVGMAIAEGNGYSDLQVAPTSTLTTLPMGSGDCTGRLAGVNMVKLRDPTTGAYVTQSGAMSALSGFLRSYVLKETANTRSKSYLGWFTSFGSLANVEWDLDFGTGASGVVAPPTQMFANTDFTAGWLNFGNPLPVTGIAVAGGVATMTRQAGSGLRLNRAQDGAVSGSLYAYSADIGGAGAGSLSWYAATATGGTQSGAAFTQLLGGGGGRNIQVFVANSNTQAIQFALGTGSAIDATVANPAAYAVAA